MLTLALALSPGLLGAPDASADRPVVAMFTLRGADAGYKPADLESLSEYVSTQIASSGQFKVVPRSEVKKTLAAQKKRTFEACYDDSCQIEIGKELAAEKAIVGSINKFGEICMVNLRLFDLKTAASEAAGTARGACTSEAVLAALDDAVQQLTGDSEKESPPEATSPPGPSAPPTTSAATAPPSSSTVFEVPPSSAGRPSRPPAPAAPPAPGDRPLKGGLLQQTRAVANSPARRKWVRKMANTEMGRCRANKDVARQEAKRRSACVKRPKGWSCRTAVRRLQRSQGRLARYNADRKNLLVRAGRAEGQSFARALDALSDRARDCWCDPQRYYLARSCGL